METEFCKVTELSSCTGQFTNRTQLLLLQKQTVKKRLCTALPPIAFGVINSTYRYKTSNQNMAKYCLRDPF